MTDSLAPESAWMLPSSQPALGEKMNRLPPALEPHDHNRQEFPQALIGLDGKKNMIQSLFAHEKPPLLPPLQNHRNTSGVRFIHQDANAHDHHIQPMSNVQETTPQPSEGGNHSIDIPVGLSRRDSITSIASSTASDNQQPSGDKKRQKNKNGQFIKQNSGLETDSETDAVSNTATLTGDKLLKCEVEGCTKSYETRQGLKWHLRTVHDNQGRQVNNRDQPPPQPSRRSERPRRGMSRLNSGNGHSDDESDGNHSRLPFSQEPPSSGGASSSRPRNGRRDTGRKHGRGDSDDEGDNVDVGGEGHDDAGDDEEPDSKKRRLNNGTTSFNRPMEQSSSQLIGKWYCGVKNCNKSYTSRQGNLYAKSDHIMRFQYHLINGHMNERPLMITGPHGFVLDNPDQLIVISSPHPVDVAPMTKAQRESTRERERERARAERAVKEAIDNVNAANARERALSKRRQEVADEPRTAFLKEWKSQYPNICCICDKPGEPGDELVICQGADCAVTVHEECYGIVGLHPSQIPRWRCDRCAYFDSSLATCVLCPYRDGPFRRVKGTDQWVHIVCAVWVEDVEFGDHERMCDITLDKIKPTAWEPVCSICTDEKDAAYGVKMPCHAYQCKKSVHPMCAHSYGVLENADDEVSNEEDEQEDPFYVFCKQHGKNGDQPKLQPWAKWVSQKHKGLAKIADAAPQHGSSSSDIRAVFEDAMSKKSAQDAEHFRHLEHDICKMTAQQTYYSATEVPRLEYEMEAAAKDIAACNAELERLRADMKLLEDSLAAIAPALGIPTGPDMMRAAAAKGSAHGHNNSNSSSVLDAFVKSGENLQVASHYQDVFASVYAAQLGGHDEYDDDDHDSVRVSGANRTTHTHRKKTGSSSSVNGTGGGAMKQKGLARTIADRQNALLAAALANAGVCDTCKSLEAPPPRPSASRSSPSKAVKSGNELVECTQCRKLWHIGCVNPPLSRPPPRGYAWLCETCDAAMSEEEAGSELDGSLPPGTDQEGSDTDAGGAARKRRRTVPPTRLNM
ncbi:hypothetical protein SmJEL517_g05827 [Synchytrium microbalum]|uniref:PHD-type domain-containing protein n=1 Tax=Synchytrium microbalum TaxID=1806994 RepID=A0A507BJ11_9FUNG|nr:uncharacterized protein SmJEL517_g05827 [Synchytrium microbalum]TPX30640.1 hypothetical protein SmJEL517_g05827 [Synchytrium microbalum]